MTTNAPLLSQLADEISANTKIIVDYLKANNLPQPSFDADGPLNPISDVDETVSAARTALINATNTLHTLTVGPDETTKFLSYNSSYVLAAMQVLCHFNVPQNVPDVGDISISDLSSKTGLNKALLPRFLRMAVANHYFAEPRPGFFAHTSFSMTLAHDERMRAAVWYRYADMLPSLSKLVEVAEKHPESDQPNEAAFALAFGDTFFEHKAKNPDRMLKFSQVMSGLAKGNAADSATSIAEAYPWGSLPDGALVVDVGGGVGNISAAIAKANPHLKFHIQDFDKLAEESAEVAKKLGVSEQIHFTPHDFFGPQPEEAKGAAVYFLRNIFHDWSDTYCRKILQPIVDVMAPDSRILISDIVQPLTNTLPKTQESLNCALDLTMLSFFSAKERPYDDWERLLSSVDSRLKITDVVGKPKMRGRDSLIEVCLSS